MRVLNKKWELLAVILASSFSLLYLYMSGFGLISTEINRGFYLWFTIVLCLLYYPFSKGKEKSKETKSPTIIDILLVILATVSIFYWINQFADYAQYRVGMPNQWDMIFGVTTILISLEVTRRVLGPILPILGLFFLIQLYFGPHMPGIFSSKGYTITRIIEYNYSSMGGIFGTVTDVFATYVMPFLIFGAFLQKSGGGDFFMDMATGLAGKTAGGPALIAVLGSAVFGSISGSPVANVVATGAFTIPLMKKVGYKPEFAGAVEAAASTGGQFLPPIMGAGAFILATLTEIPYSQVIIMATVPALLYYFSLVSTVYFEAKKMGLRGLTEAEIPDWRLTLKQGWYYIFAVVLIIGLIVLKFSPPFAAACTTLFVIICSMFRKETRLNGERMIDCLTTAAKSSIVVGSTAGTLGIIMGGIMLSGLGVKFSELLIGFSGGNIIITLLLVTLLATIVGMGLPTTAAYIVMAILAAPALIQLGIPTIQAHLLCFWLSMASNITPPVCVAAFAAASVADADPMKTGLHSFKLGIFLFIMPLAFIYYPEVLLIGYDLLPIVTTVICFIMFSLMFSAAFQGWYFKELTWLERTACLVLGMAVMANALFIKLLAVLLIVAASCLAYQVGKKITDKQSVQGV